MTIFGLVIVDDFHTVFLNFEFVTIAGMLFCHVIRKVFTHRKKALLKFIPTVVASDCKTCLTAHFTLIYFERLNIWLLRLLANEFITIRASHVFVWEKLSTGW